MVIPRTPNRCKKDMVGDFVGVSTREGQGKWRICDAEGDERDVI